MGLLESREEALSRLAKSSIVVFLSILLAKIAGYFYKIAIARYATPEEFGTFSLTLVLIGIGITLSSLGLSEGIVRYISFLRGKKNNASMGTIINDVERKILFMSFFICLGIFFGAEFIASFFQKNQLLTYMLQITAISIPFTVLSGFYLALLRGHEDIKKYTFVSNATQGILKVLLLCTALLFFKASFALPLSHVLTAFILTFLGWKFTYNIRRKYSTSTFSKSAKQEKLRKEVFYYSLPLLYTGIIFSMLFWTDSLVVGHFLSPEQVGMYSVAITLIALLGILPELFMQLFLPLLSNYFAKGKMSDIQYLVRRVNKWVLIGNVPLAIALYTFPGVFINLLFGPAYSGAEESIKILAFGGLLGSLTNGLSTLLTAQGKTKLLAYNVTAMVILNLVLNILLVEKWGILGVAQGTAITWLVFLGILFIQVRKTIATSPIAKTVLIKVIFSALSYILFLKWIGTYISINLGTLILLLVFGGVLYVGLLMFLKTFDTQDYAVLLSIKKRFFEKVKAVRN